jgi:eukaryotic-like serine/threonine-protein kinase
VATDANSPDERRAKLHARLALVKHDEWQVAPLVEEFLSGNVAYLGVIRDQLAPYATRLEGDFWKLLHDGALAPPRRFRAGLALATYATESTQWTRADDALLAEQLLATNAEQQPRLRDLVRPILSRLLSDLERLFGAANLADAQRLAAANALADFAADDAKRLALLLPIATPEQFAVVYPLVSAAKHAAARQSLVDVVNEAPSAELKQAERLTLGQRRAGAAIALLLESQREAALAALRVDDDPESLTQFVHRCRARGVSPQHLLECIDQVADRRHHAPHDGNPHAEREDYGGADGTPPALGDPLPATLFGLLLALGEFELDELPEARRESFLTQLADWYANDPSSAIHGACGWLLRHWGQGEAAKNVDETPVAYAPDREWFTLKIEPHQPEAPARRTPAGDASHQPEVPARKDEASATDENEPSSLALRVSTGEPPPFYITFVVFPPGKYTIGSPDDEADRLGHERRHEVELTRPFALSDREVTWAQFNPFDAAVSNFNRHDAWEKQFGHTLTPAEPAFGVNWFEAVSYCRWLTRQAGMADADQCYADPTSLSKDGEGNPKDWPVDLAKRGFRLPTEAEWETACRGGMLSAYSFGNDPQLLAHYGWFADNSSKWSHPARLLRPTSRGLFDIHGNLFEWCHDWYGEYANDAADPVGAPTGADRVSRGGGWHFVAAFCRSAYRFRYRPTYRDYDLGFRLALGSVQPSE